MAEPDGAPPEYCSQEATELGLETDMIQPEYYEQTSRGNTENLRLVDTTSVSVMLKYLIFGFNILIWLVGVILLSVGIWAATQKNITAISAVVFNPVVFLIIAGTVIFVLGFLGCLGALRENICFLAIYAILVGAIFLLLVAGVVILFVFRDWVKERLRSPLERMIRQYRNDQDLEDLIDWVQADWLQCCGVDDYMDWEKNMYFNCSSPGVEACGVPFSCCVPSDDPNLLSVNYKCGEGVLRKDRLNLALEKIIYMEGCLEKGDAWFQHYMIPVAGAIVGVTVVLILGVCCALNLIADIRRQLAKWR